MLDCIEETSYCFHIYDSLNVVGHSMGGLCSIAYALSDPIRVRKLVLIDTVSGGPAIMRCKGLPWGMRRIDPDFWRFIFWGWRLSSALGNLTLHKKFLSLLWKHSYTKKEYIPEMQIAPEDNWLPAPIRDKWPLVARKLDYSHQLKEIRVPTLVYVGRFDPQAPMQSSEELNQSIKKSRLIIFEKSWHYPFIEERQRFEEELECFLAT